MKKFRKTEKLIEDYQLLNEIMDYADDRTIILNKKWEHREKNESCRFYSFLWETQKYITFTTRYFRGSIGKVVTFKFDKFEDNKTSDVQGSTVYATLQRYYKTADFTKDDYVRSRLCYSEAEGKFLVTVAGVMGYNRQYNRTRQQAWEYDRTSAYAWHLAQDLPLGDTYDRERVVKEGEIGFFLLGDTVKLAYPGKYASFVFKLEPSPFKPFVDKYFEAKKKAQKGSLDRQRMKDMLNFGVGYFQRKNPFIRYYIVLKANEIIEKLVDENTLLWNTDAIYSRVERTDLDIGDGLGQFKVEDSGPFAYIGNNYQWRDEPPHSRGVIRKLYKQGFDLLVDPMPRADDVKLYRVTWRNRIAKVEE